MKNFFDSVIHLTDKLLEIFLMVPQFQAERGVCNRQDANRKQPRVVSVPDCHRGDRNPRRHLNDRVQRILAA